MNRCKALGLLGLSRTVGVSLALCASVNLANAEERLTYRSIAEPGDVPEWCGIMSHYPWRGHDFDACRAIGTVFRDDPRLPEMVVVMGPDAVPLAVGRFEITFEDWQLCRQGGFCRDVPDDNGWGRGRRPVINVPPIEVERFLAWMSKVSGMTYRGMTDAEWVHVAQSDETVTHQIAHFDADRTIEVGSLRPNAAGLYDVLGNVWEMTFDCDVANGNLRRLRCEVVNSRGGSWANDIAYVSAQSVNDLSPDKGNRLTGFRVARDMRLSSSPPDGLDMPFQAVPASTPDLVR
jgi:hypothetical protein